MNATSEESSKGVKLQIHMYNTLHNREWLQMDGITQRIWEVAYSLYEI